MGCSHSTVAIEPIVVAPAPRAAERETLTQFDDTLTRVNTATEYSTGNSNSNATNATVRRSGRQGGWAVDPHTVALIDHFSKSARLLLASRFGQDNEVVELFGGGVDVNCCAHDSRGTPLHFACWGGPVVAFDRVLVFCDFVDEKGNASQPFIYFPEFEKEDYQAGEIVDQRRMQIIRMLLRHKDINVHQEDVYNNTCYQLAIRRSNHAVAIQFIRRRTGAVTRRLSVRPNRNQRAIWRRRHVPTGITWPMR